MSEYTPTTDEVRAWAVLASPLTEAEFDRWLASEKAKAWDEGYLAGEQDTWDHEATGDWDSGCISNPYRTYKLGEYSNDSA